MKNQLLIASLLAAPAIASYLVPDYTSGFASRDLHLDSDYDYGLLARSALYDDDGKVELYRRKGGGFGLGASQRQKATQLSPQNSKNLSPQNSLQSQNSFHTAVGSPGNQSPRPNNEEVRVNIPKQTSSEIRPHTPQTPPKQTTAFNQIKNVAQQGANFAKNNQNTLIGVRDLEIYKDKALM